MTTVLADARLGIMVCDSLMTDGIDRKWSSTKVHRIRGCLAGVAGDSQTYIPALGWLRHGGPPPEWKDDSTDLLVLSPNDGLLYYAGGPEPERVACGREAIGTGAAIAMAVYEATGWTDPVLAVRMAAKYDPNSGGRVRVYRLERSA